MVTSLLQPRYVGLALAVALMLGCFPSGAQARVVGSMPSDTQEVSPRQACEARIHRLLAEEKVAEALKSLKLTPDQVRSRLDQLDDTQLEELAQNLETVKTGKATAILLALVAIVLIAVLIYMQIEEA